ncbi:MAG: hypothetical protein QW469_00515 [Candidatus Aenigmatarchaeota archaeon]
MFKPLVDMYSTQTARAIIDDGLTVKVGDVIIPLSTAGSTDIITNEGVDGDVYPLGVVIGFSTYEGGVIGSGTNPNTTPAELIVPDDNTTGAKYCAVYIPITAEMEFEADLDRPAGTTTGSDKPYVYFNLADSQTIDESSVVPHDDETAPLQVLSLGVIPGETSKIRCRFAKRLYR